ncbi:MAG: glycosyltransferase [Planctomycetota bacterium]
MLIGVLSVYNEAQFFGRCIRSIREKVDRVIVVDGAYVSFPYDKPWSTDGTIELARKYADKIITTENAWESQIVKRNRYLLGKEGDWYLMIDGDEELAGIPKGYEEQDDWNISLYRTDGISAYPVYRLFRHRRGIRYFGTHHCLMIGDEILNKRKMETIMNCNIIHFNAERKQERVMAKGQYYRSRTEEKEFRQINKI